MHCVCWSVNLIFSPFPFPIASLGTAAGARLRSHLKRNGKSYSRADDQVTSQPQMRQFIYAVPNIYEAAVCSFFSEAINRDEHFGSASVSCYKLALAL